MYIFEHFVNQQPILHYTLVIGCCTILQKIFDAITADTGLSKGHKEDMHYMDTKEHQSTFVKNVTSYCPQTVLKHTIFLKYSEYKRLCNSLCITFAFVVVCVNCNFISWKIFRWPPTPGVSLNWRKAKMDSSRQAYWKWKIISDLLFSHQNLQYKKNKNTKKKNNKNKKFNKIWKVRTEWVNDITVRVRCWSVYYVKLSIKFFNFIFCYFLCFYKYKMRSNFANFKSYGIKKIIIVITATNKLFSKFP